MQRVRKWIQVAVVLTLLLTLIIWDSKQGAKMDENLELHGTRVRAVVTRVRYARGYIMDLTFRYKGDYRTVSARTAEFEPASGDSVSILFLPDQLGKEVLVENRFFTVPRKSYFGWVDGH